MGHSDKGAVTDSASRVEVVSAGEKIGGLVGDNSNAEIHRSYSAGVVDSAGAPLAGVTCQSLGTASATHAYVYITDVPGGRAIKAVLDAKGTGSRSPA